MAPVADDLCADADPLFLQARHRPIFEALWPRQSAREIAEIMGERVQCADNYAPVAGVVPQNRGSSGECGVKRIERRWADFSRRGIAKALLKLAILKSSGCSLRALQSRR